MEKDDIIVVSSNVLFVVFFLGIVDLMLKIDNVEGIVFGILVKRWNLFWNNKILYCCI